VEVAAVATASVEVEATVRVAATAADVKLTY
jgi:hypothetical protein